MTKEQIEKEAKAECFMLTVNTIGIDQRDVELAYILGRNKSIEQIEALKKENKELKTVKIPQLERRIASIRGCHSVDAKKLNARIEQVERLKQENAELKAKYDTRLRENTGLKIHNAYVEKKLAEAKYIIRELLDFDFLPDVDIKIQAEKFIKE